MINKARFLVLIFSIVCLTPVHALDNDFSDGIQVDSTSDVADATLDGICDDGAGNCTLRAAIQEANNQAGLDTIDLTTGTYTLTLSGGDDTAALGDLDINDDITITGIGPRSTYINGGNIDRIFDVAPSVSGLNVTLSGLTLQNGNASGFNGGAIQNQNASTLTLTNITLTSNTAALGGALYNTATATISLSILTGNTANNDGAAIANSGGTITLSNITLSANTAGRNGGAVFNAAGANTSMSNVTVYGNTANAATDGGGALYLSGATGSVTLSNTLLSGNTAVTCGGEIADIAADLNNLEDGDTCGFIPAPGGSDLINITAPGLDVLADNGGNTDTHALLAGSVAIDAGSNATCQATDQRGVIRVASIADACDIGAYEAAPSVDLTIDAQGSDDCLDDGDSLVYTLTIQNIGQGTASGVSLVNTLPAKASYVSDNAGCSLSGSTLTCALADLAPSDTVIVSITVTADETGLLTLNSDVRANETESDSSNNSVEVDTRVNCSNCFIATAAYGSPDASGLVILRAFRDNYLLATAPGAWLVNRYYQYSPAIADSIRHKEGLRAWLRAGLGPIVLLGQIFLEDSHAGWVPPTNEDKRQNK